MKWLLPHQGFSALNIDERVDELAEANSLDPSSKKKRRRSDQSMSGKSGSGEPQIGRALRSVYDQTVGEAIPPEMLELLGKLG